jgi:hypothetical protein
MRARSNLHCHNLTVSVAVEPKPTPFTLSKHENTPQTAFSTTRAPETVKKLNFILNSLCVRARNTWEKLQFALTPKGL